MTESAYIPGMCNINKAEIAYRRKAMWFGIILSIIIFTLLFVFHAEWWLGAVLLFVPVYIGAIGYLQVTQKFCVSYGSSGKQNASDDSDAVQAVVDSDARRADKAKTKRMNLQALGATLLVLVVTSVILYVA